MKKEKIVLAVLFVLSLTTCLVYANGLNLNSIGTKALSMGGAFVALADDFSAIYWNPAGMTQFTQKYLGFYGVDIIPFGSYKLDINYPGIGNINLVDAETEVKHNLAGMLAYYLPVNERMVAGFGVYTPSGSGATWKGADFAAISNDNPNLKWQSKIGLVSFSPSLAFKVNEQISVGAAVNLNYGMFDVAMPAGSAEVAVSQTQLINVDLGQYEESMSGWGYGATIGLLVKPSEKISLGATFKTASKLNLEGEAEISGFTLLGFPSASDLERELTWPVWLAGGIAFKPVIGLTLTADLQYTNWSVLEKLKTDYKDTYWQLIMGQKGEDERDFYWENAAQIRFGAEYWLSSFLAIRGGFYIDPAPVPDRTMTVLIPSYDFNVVTFGFGYSMNGLQLDFGMEMLLGKDREIDLEYGSAMPGFHGMKIFVPNFSVNYRF
ncbi:MAG: outer membrane protein transport protein [Candidatus Aminicenantes bacterium]|nr:outer membrane protein transport protein [Candidatus Aminicenantes bacterium]